VERFGRSLGLRLESRRHVDRDRSHSLRNRDCFHRRDLLDGRFFRAGQWEPVAGVKAQDSLPIPLDSEETLALRLASQIVNAGKAVAAFVE
jgi:hypothetical protein